MKFNDNPDAKREFMRKYKCKEAEFPCTELELLFKAFALPGVIWDHPRKFIASNGDSHFHAGADCTGALTVWPWSARSFPRGRGLHSEKPSEMNSPTVISTRARIAPNNGKTTCPRAVISMRARIARTFGQIPNAHCSHFHAGADCTC